jgi:metal-dependent amidase/aminoacylase/carboxypeptidase family protein
LVKKSRNNPAKSALKQTDKIFDRLVEIRRGFHENPELASKRKANSGNAK